MPLMRLVKTAVVILAMVVGTSGLSAQLRVRPVGELPNDTALRLMLRKLGDTQRAKETFAEAVRTYGRHPGKLEPADREWVAEAERNL